jgi:membrane dipeptidase
MNEAALKAEHKLETRVVNCVAAPWYEDLSHALIDECIESGVSAVGVSAHEIWDGTVESIENMQYVKEVVRSHGRAYLIERKSDLADPGNFDKVGVLMGFQNPKPYSDSTKLLEGFLDMGLRCISLAFKENSYFGCGFASDIDTGLTPLGKEAIKVLNRRGGVIDLSHSGDRTAMDAVQLSEQPVIFSHSAPRTWVEKQPGRQLIHSVTSSAYRRAAPDELIRAVAAKGGVICPEGRTKSAADFVDQIDYLVQMVGSEHVGVAAQDDWHRSEKDSRRIQPYLPGYGSQAGDSKRVFGNDYRIYRLEGSLGPRLLYPENLRVELRKRNYDERSIAGILGGNLLRVLSAVLPD